MKVKYWAPATVELPDDELPDLFAAVHTKWDMKPGAPVHVIDLVNEAAAKGLIFMPDSYRLDDEDEQLTEEDLAPPKKPARKKRRKD